MCEIKDEFIDCNAVCGIHTGKENQQTIIGTLHFYCFISQNVSHAIKITWSCDRLTRANDLHQNTNFLFQILLLV